MNLLAEGDFFGFLLRLAHCWRIWKKLQWKIAFRFRVPPENEPSCLSPRSFFYRLSKQEQVACTRVPCSARYRTIMQDRSQTATCSALTPCSVFNSAMVSKIASRFLRQMVSHYWDVKSFTMTVCVLMRNSDCFVSNLDRGIWNLWPYWFMWEKHSS